MDHMGYRMLVGWSELMGDNRLSQRKEGYTKNLPGHSLHVWLREYSHTMPYIVSLSTASTTFTVRASKVPVSGRHDICVSLHTSVLQRFLLGMSIAALLMDERRILWALS